MRIVAKFNLSIVALLALCLLVGAVFTWGGVSRIQQQMDGLVDGSGRQSATVMGEDFRALVWRTLLGIGFSLLVLVGALWALVVHQVKRPLQRLAAHVRAVAEGDLASEMVLDSRDEFGAVGDDLNRMTGNLREMVVRLRGTFGGLEKVSGELAKVAGGISSGAGRQAEALMTVSSSMEEMSATIRTVAGNVEEMTHSSEENASAIIEIGASVEEVARSAENLSAASDQASSTVTEMDASIQEVAKNVERLSGFIVEVTTSITQMDASIKTVDGNASEAFRISGEVSAVVSREGEATAEKALAGINQIRDTVTAAAEIIRSLGERSRDIGKIVGLINEVNEQTNLLSLNAAIIAAQAGEQGRAFAVVASEIRDLSDKTAASTKEIGALIATLQKESRHAIVAMEEGSRAVENGVRLVEEVKVTLRRAAEGSVRASEASRGIAVSTAEQARAIVAVAGNAQRISEMSKEIARATREQSAGSRQVMDAAVKIREQAAQVERSTGEQARGISSIGASSEKGMSTARDIMRATQEEKKSSDLIVQNVQSIHGITRENLEGVGQLNGMVQLLAEQASLLRREIDRLRVR